jgi:hypothetical protein
MREHTLGVLDAWPVFGFFLAREVGRICIVDCGFHVVGRFVVHGSSGT